MRSGIAERTPKRRASYEAALTTPRSSGGTTDDDRSAAQLGVVPLLDGSEERVEIDVQDRGAAADGHAPIIHGRSLPLGLDRDGDLGRQAGEDADRDLVRAQRLERLGSGRPCDDRPRCPDGRAHRRCPWR